MNKKFTISTSPDTLGEIPMKKIRFVVQDENLLGYVHPDLPANSVQILATSIIRGSIFSWMDGNVTGYPERQRPATVRDFESFRVCHEGYMKDPELYEPIPE